MNYKSTRLADQLRRNRVALISLLVAIISLSYNTWRNEASEDNRTQRLVSIEILLQLGELQQIAWHNHYDGDTEDKGNLRAGWAKVLTIRDIATVLDEPMPASAEELWHVWDDNYRRLAVSTEAKNNIMAAIATSRADTLTVLEALN